MADGTKIEWTDATWNPITGCAVVSPGCTNCYAMKLAGTRLKHIPSRAGLTRDTKAGPVWTGEIRFNAEWLDQPLRWRRPRMIFVCAHGDLFAEGVTDEMLDHVFAVMALAPQHTFQVLTKRPERMRDYVRRSAGRIADTIIRLRRGQGNAHIGGVPLAHIPLGRAWWPLQNVWLGVSAEDQRRADERIPMLLDTLAAVRWVSAEPLLGPLDISDYLMGHEECGMVGQMISYRPPLDWVVVGGESGHGARPMHPDWARSLRDQCARDRIPFLFKQWGHWAPRRHAEPSDLLPYPKATIVKPSGSITSGLMEYGPDAWVVDGVGKKAAGRMLDGVQHDGYPPADEILF
ncbi:DUF5131 family protein [Aureimonas phyllosphaerae]|uniref:DUF5131 family protein n=1 Tax=Aureimonas phyllosphaerae TaxID=1166078 RepID=UPI003A5C6299